MSCSVSLINWFRCPKQPINIWQDCGIAQRRTWEGVLASSELWNFRVTNFAIVIFLHGLQGDKLQRWKVFAPTSWDVVVRVLYIMIWPGLSTLGIV